MSDDPQWLAWRAAGTTASDIARSVTGRYGGHYAVVAEKRGVVPGQAETEQMRRGHRWEERIADAVLVLLGYYVHGEQMWCEHADHPRHRATVDGLLARQAEASIDEIEAGLEVKTCRRGVAPKWDYYEVQCQWQAWVLGLPRVLLVVAIIDDVDDEIVELKFRWVEFDPYGIADLIAVDEQLWAHVEAGTLPDPDTAGALEVVKKIHTRADKTADAVELDDLAEDLARLHEVKAAVKAVTDERDLIEARIRERLGQATKGRTGDGWKVSLSAPAKVVTPEAEERLLAAFPQYGKTVLDRARLKAEDPETYEAAREAIGARRLTITPPKERK